MPASQRPSLIPEELSDRRLLIVGNSNLIHVGAHFFNAAEACGISVKLCDTNAAYASSWPVNKFNWWLRDRRPSRLAGFSEQVVELCRRFQPHWLLSTGIGPIHVQALERIGELGVKRLNYSTDDPWNLAHRAAWFMKSLRVYDHVFSPRRANLEDLRQLGCKQVSYLPFAYAPELHFAEPPTSSEEEKLFASDVVFAGGADLDRVAYIKALLDAGVNVALYGGYWQRFSDTKANTRGHADPQTVRKAIGGAKVALCLVRRANRDGHAMRSFEVPAIGACMLVEDTQEHREIFGRGGDAVSYFRSLNEMVERMRWLIDHEGERRRLASAVYDLIRNDSNTYEDRLRSMLFVSENSYPEEQ